MCILVNSFVSSVLSTPFLTLEKWLTHDKMLQSTVRITNKFIHKYRSISHALCVWHLQFKLQVRFIFSGYFYTGLSWGQQGVGMPCNVWNTRMLSNKCVCTHHVSGIDFNSADKKRSKERQFHLCVHQVLSQRPSMSRLWQYLYIYRRQRTHVDFKDGKANHILCHFLPYRACVRISRTIHGLEVHSFINHN